MGEGLKRLPAPLTWQSEPVQEFLRALGLDQHRYMDVVVTIPAAGVVTASTSFVVREGTINPTPARKVDDAD